jgi:hypothetical protein
MTPRSSISERSQALSEDPEAGAIEWRFNRSMKRVLPIQSLQAGHKMALREVFPQGVNGSEIEDEIFLAEVIEVHVLDEHRVVAVLDQHASLDLGCVVVQHILHIFL